MIAYNGEIQNFRELGEDLETEGVRFETRSDTEVLLRLCKRRGAAALDRLIGKFAFAVWDRARGEFFLARGRVGIKPPHVVELPGGFLFAFETAALLAYAGWTRTPNPHALQHHLALRHVPGDVGLLREVRRLPPGHWPRLRDGHGQLDCYCVGKYLLRRLAERVLPTPTTRRRRMPFYAPVENYFQEKQFVEMMDDLLGERSVRERGIFRPEAVAELRRVLHDGEFLLMKRAFSLMILELWFRIFIDLSLTREAERRP